MPKKIQFKRPTRAQIRNSIGHWARVMFSDTGASDCIIVGLVGLRDHSHVEVYMPSDRTTTGVEYAQILEIGKAPQACQSGLTGADIVA